MIQGFPIFLLDLDGVLIEPIGYRKAIQSSLAYFTEKMGLGDLYPGEDAIARFESIGMTCEWDILPVMLAAFFDQLLRHNYKLELPPDVLDACEAVRTYKASTPEIDFKGLVSAVKISFEPGMEFASRSLELNYQNPYDPPFPGMVGHPLLHSLLTNTRALDGAITTRVFQHFTLGSKRYEQLTGLQSLFESESYLEKYDNNLISTKSIDALLLAWKEGKIGTVIYTARPSLPMGRSSASFNYSPEAEVALEKLGLSELPLIGAGKMNWLAEQIKMPSHKLIKPSKPHVLTAVAAAYTRQIEPALSAVEKYLTNGEYDYFREMPKLSVHVFEDSGPNITSVRKAMDSYYGPFSKQYTPVTAWGIGENYDKYRALKHAGATVFKNIDEALQAAFAFEGIN